MSKFLYPIYKLNIESYKKWWLYHKKAGGSGILSEILQGFSFNLENTLNRKFKLFEIEGNSVQNGSPSPDNEVPIKSAGDNGFINEKISNENIFDGIMEQGAYSGSDGTTLISSPKYIRSKNYTNVVAGETYIITIKAKGTNQTNGNIFIYNIDETLISTINGLLNSFTIPTGGRKIKINVFNNNNIAPSDVEFAMMNIGSTSIPYVPHKEQTYSMPVQAPFRSIGDVRDKFEQVNGVLNEKHIVYRYKLIKGTITDFNTTYNRLTLLFTGVNVNSGAIAGLSNVAKVLTNVSVNTTYTNSIVLRQRDNGGVYIYCWLDGITSRELAENFLDNNDVYVDFPIATPTYLPCTETQIQQLENKPSTYKEMTIIQSQDETPAYLKIQYWKEVQP